MLRRLRKKVRNQTPRNTKITSIMRSQLIPQHHIESWLSGGEAEKFLKVNISVDSDRIVTTLKETLVGPMKPSHSVREWVESSIEDAYKRLLSPSIEAELRLQLKQSAETEAIRVFSDNLENLLLPPIPNKTVLGVDPGLRTGSKFAVVDETGKLLASTTLHFELGDKEGPKTARSKAEILKLITTHRVSCVAIGNGTGSREMNRVVTAVIKENQLKDVKRLVVNEAGASVYSTMDIAREEFLDLDPTVRSVVSIARRLCKIHWLNLSKLIQDLLASASTSMTLT